MGQFSIKEVLNFTYTLYRNRFAYMTRDVLKSVTFRKQKRYNQKGKLIEEKYLVTTYSYPQYAPYAQKGKRQRTIKHEYDITLDLDKTDVNTKNWKLRVGSGRKWVKRVAPHLIRSRKNPKGRFLSIGDWNARVMGLNGDFYFRQATPLQRYGHLFGRLWETHNEEGAPFFGKHDLRLIKTLVEKKLLAL